MSVEDFRSCTPDARARAVRALSGRLNSVHVEILDLLLAVEAEGDWRDDGATDVAAWLEAMTEIASGTAREWKQVAHRLVELPRLRQTFREGTLSWDQIRVIVSFATPDEDEVLAVELIGCSVAQLEAAARARRRVTRRERSDASRHRRLRRRRDPDLGGVRYSMFLPDEDAATVDAGLERAAETAGPDAETGTWAPAESRYADAVVDWAARSLGSDADADLATVVIHADADVVDAHLADRATTDEDERGREASGVTADGGGAITIEGVLRLLCDARVEYVLHDVAGCVVGVAEATRTIPAWLRRVVEHRDLHCRFPGCHRRIRHVHHIDHWANGGHTNADNLAGFCWHHHHLLHEGHPDRGGPWTVTGDPNTTLVFTHPDGVRRIESTVRPYRLDRVRHRRWRIEGHERKVRVHTGRRRGPPGATPA